MFLGFKVDVDIFKKLVVSACYDKQHVCSYLQPFTRYTNQWRINNHFLDRCPSLTPTCAGLLKYRGSGLKLLISTFHAKNFTGTLSCLSPAISTQFTPEMRVTAQNHEKFTKTPNFGSSRSFKVIDVDTSQKLVASACYDKQHVCAYLQPFPH